MADFRMVYLPIICQIILSYKSCLTQTFLIDEFIYFQIVSNPYKSMYIYTKLSCKA